MGVVEMGNEAIDEEVWRATWGIEGPPKLRHFLWNSCQGNLAVKDRLVYLHIATDATCPICYAPSETIVHSLFECELAKEIWLHSNLANALVGAPTSSFVDRWLWITRKCNTIVVGKMAAFMWASWRLRNILLFENEQPHFAMLTAGFVRMVEEYNTYSSKVHRPMSFGTDGVRTQESNSWTRPPQGYVKLNTDAHVVEKCRTGLGVVILDEAGVLVVVAVKKTHNTTPEIAEALAVRYGLIVRRLGYDRICVESDSINVVKAIKSNTCMPTPIHLIYNDIKQDSLFFVSFNISHVKRACNTVAHLVARWDTSDNT
ncbi:uncharacterized protein [Spinacia oleracea]|uniref:RNase H type-1 domain-containing protein n=1 Tax=Spinacia oleracea TaxID=3562 RepID=A0A9R0K6F0_SPIOL|nr:uncharacterized protein LOC110799297 [Spinacia oleracea]